MDVWIQADVWLFRLINEGCSNLVFDAVLPWCRERWVWSPLYLFVVAFLWSNFGWRRGGWVVLGIAVSVALADVTSSELIKKQVRRVRPCNDPALQAAVHLRIASCGSGYSFTSSHAANHFAVAVFLIGVFARWERRLRSVLLGWAGLVAFSQVYVGVHFPADVVAGALLGSGVGWAVGEVWKKWLIRHLPAAV